MALSELPLASGSRHKKVFCRLGWVVRRDGNHIVMVNGSGVMISIPNHSEVKKQTLKKIVAAAGLSDSEYRAAFDEA